MIFAPIESAVRELSNGENADFFCTNIHLFQPLTFRKPKLAVLKPPTCELAFFLTISSRRNVRKNRQNVRKMRGKTVKM